MAREVNVTIDRKFYLSDHGDSSEVLSGLRFDVPAGQFFTLLGPSGCGKSTLLRIIAGLDEDYRGGVQVGGRAILSPSPEIGLVFQEARLFPWMRVRSNIRFGLEAGHEPRASSHRVKHVLEMLGLETAADKWPRELSGGMAKRVALGRGIINLPAVLLLDEPFTGLDTLTKFELQDELKKILDEERTTVILVTHDIDEAVYLSDRVALLTGAPAQIAKVLDIPLPEPRRRESMEFNLFRARVLQEVLEVTNYESGTPSSDRASLFGAGSRA